MWFLSSHEVDDESLTKKIEEIVLQKPEIENLIRRMESARRVRKAEKDTIKRLKQEEKKKADTRQKKKELKEKYRTEKQETKVRNPVKLPSRSG